jgi:hypothetical protein
MRLHWTVLVCMVVAQSAVAQPSDRVVDVQVANGVITVSPDPATMKKQQNRILWRLNTAGFSFTADGIVIHAGGSEYGECGPRGNSSTVYVCRKLRHIDRKDYKYDVNLRGPGSQALKLDPVIRND